jgi:prepilin-type processing-associated H-X9-DG protein
MSSPPTPPNSEPPVGCRQFGVLVVLVCAGLAYLLFGVFVPRAREAARRATCTSHLKLIGGAMLNYYDDHGCFPPAYLPGPDGKPAHSWRLLLLPYLGDDDLYRQYRFDEPWDGPNNRRLLDKLDNLMGSPIYKCPSDGTSGREGTNYLMITGPGSLFEDGKSPRLKDIRDGPEQTVVIVEVAATGIRWSEPRDLEFDKMNFSINDPAGNCICSRHPGGALVLMADGSVHFLNDGHAADVRARITPDAGDHPSD